MTDEWRARAERSFALDGVAIHMRRRVDQSTVQVVAPLTLHIESHLVDEGVAATVPPMLVLDDEAGRALYAALDEHYGRERHTGICGDQRPAIIDGEWALFCDINAGHEGWHGADQPSGTRSHWRAPDSDADAAR